MQRPLWSQLRASMADPPTVAVLPGVPEVKVVWWQICCDGRFVRHTALAFRVGKARPDLGQSCKPDLQLQLSGDSLKTPEVPRDQRRSLLCAPGKLPRCANEAEVVAGVCRLSVSGVPLSSQMRRLWTSVMMVDADLSVMWVREEGEQQLVCQLRTPF